MGIAFSIEVFQVVPDLSQVVHPNIDLTLGKDTDAVRCRIFIPDMSLHMKIYVLEIRGVDVDRIGRFGRILLIDPKRIPLRRKQIRLCSNEQYSVFSL